MNELRLAGALLAGAVAACGTAAPRAGSSSSSGGSVANDLCVPCSTAGGCGSAAVCVTEPDGRGSYCAPVCTTGSACPAGAECLDATSTEQVCYPSSQTCVGWRSSTSGATSASTSSSGAGATTATSTGAASTSAASSTGTAAAAAATTTTGTSSSGASTAIASSSTGASTSSSSGAGTTSTSGTSGSSGALLRFAFTGDTRPANADDVANYPTPIVMSIVASMSTKSLAFALDTGDHAKLGQSGTDTAAQAQMYEQQMLLLYTGATAALGVPWYLTMGNHECWDNKSLCDLTDPVLTTFMTFVSQQVSTTTPYYTFDVTTPMGVATFVFVADTAWDDTESTWLDAALTHGDASAYTIIAKHVPSSNTTDFPTNADEMAVIEAHKFSLLVDSHAHLYQYAGEGGREVTLGLGGAPLDDPGTDAYGYGLVEQQTDGTLTVTEYDAATDAPVNSFSVNPNG